MIPGLGGRPNTSYYSFSEHPGYRTELDNLRSKKGERHKVTRTSSNFGSTGITEGEQRPSRWWWWLGRNSGANTQRSHPSSRTLASNTSRVNLSPAIPPTVLPANASNQGIPETRWMPDEKCQVCMHCGSRFSLWTRKHHCRLCGQIFCWKCCNHIVDGNVIHRHSEQRCRLCTICIKYVGTDLPVGTNLPAGAAAPFIPKAGNSSSNSGAGGTGASSSWIPPVQVVSMDDDSASVPAHTDEQQRDAADTDGQYSGSRSDERDQHFSEDDDDSDDFYREESDDSSPWLPESPSFPSDRFHVSDDGACPQRVDSGLAMCVEGEEWGSKTPIKKWEEIGQHLFGLPDAPETPAIFGQPHAEEKPAAHEDSWKRMSEVATRYFVQLVTRRCIEVAGGLEEPTHIRKICQLAQQVADHLANCAVDDDMDILNYVKVKRIPCAGHMKDSEFIDGVVFSGDVVHRGMADTIHDCNVTLLRGLTCYDKGSDDNQLTPLTDLANMESDLLEMGVGKIVFDLPTKPELILCHGSVSRIAQDKLRESSISLVIGVKEHILNAVARCMGKRVCKSVNLIIRGKKDVNAKFVGKCRKFRVCRLGAAGSKSLVYIEGSGDKKFSTVCLRGGIGLPKHEAMEFVTRAKQVLLWSIRLARHLQLESELLFELWCEPWPRAPPPIQALEPNPSTAEWKGREAENLDVICYQICRRNAVFEQAQVFRLPAYGLPEFRPLPLRSDTQQSGKPRSEPKAEPKLEGLVGGSQIPVKDSFRDCTLREWFDSCLSSIPPSSTASPGVAEMYHRGNDDHRSHKASAEDPPLTTRPQCATRKRHLKHLEKPPVPLTGKVLCFQHGTNRICCMLLYEENETQHPHPRSQNGDREARSAHTRWSLRTRDVTVQSDTLSLSQALFTRDKEISSTAQDPFSDNDSDDCSSVEAYWWCETCKRQITPRNALSNSALNCSLTRFWEMLLKNDASFCSPLAAEIYAEMLCTCEKRPAFRSQLRLCQSPERPIEIGFKWEPAVRWALQGVNMPLWDPLTCMLSTPTPRHGRDANKVPDDYEISSNLKELVNLLRDLEDSIWELTVCILSKALSFPALRDSDAEMKNVLSEFAATRSYSSLADIPELVEDQKWKPDWWNGWVWDRRKEWHKLIRFLVGWRRAVGQCMRITPTRLRHDFGCVGIPNVGQSGNRPVSDPILASYVQRDILEAFDRDALKYAYKELNALWKLHDPDEQNLQTLSKMGCERLATTVDEHSKPSGPASGAILQKVIGFLSGKDPTTSVGGPMSSAPALGGRQIAPRARVTFPGGFGDDSSVVCIGSSSSRHDRCHRRTRSVSRSGGKCGKCREGHSRALSYLPARVGKVLTMIEKSQELQQGQHVKLERGMNGVCFPVKAEDIGSIIAHALLSRQAHEKMEAEWHALTGRRCCPLAESTGAGGARPSCWASFPSSLCQNFAKFAESGSREPGVNEQSVSSNTLSQTAPAESKTAAPGAPGTLTPVSISPSLVPVGVPLVGTSGVSAASSSTALPVCGSSVGIGTVGDNRPAAASSTMQPPTKASLEELAQKPWNKLPPERAQQSQFCCAKNHAFENNCKRRGFREALTGQFSKEPIVIEFGVPPEKQWKVEIFHAPQYHLIRHWFCGDDLNFARALFRCKNANLKGGKSEAKFMHTHDGRFLLKEVSKKAEVGFLKNEHALFWYADRVLFEKLPSVLAMILGVFSVSSNSSRARRYFIVQRNVLYNFHEKRNYVFDLKGTENRRAPENGAIPSNVAPSNADELSDIDELSLPVDQSSKKKRLDIPVQTCIREGPVYWDQDFRDWIEGKPLCLVSNDLQYLEAALWNDTQLLSFLKLMDYSLLLGTEGDDPITRSSGATQPASEPQGTLFLGIIDYLQPYTTQKKVEAAGKTLVNGRSATTVIAPDEYAARFREAMSTFFIGAIPSSF